MTISNDILFNKTIELIRPHIKEFGFFAKYLNQKVIPMSYDKEKKDHGLYALQLVLTDKKFIKAHEEEAFRNNRHFVSEIYWTEYNTFEDLFLNKAKIPYKKHYNFILKYFKKNYPDRKITEAIEKFKIK